MVKQTDLEKFKENGKKFIKDLPNIRDLRDWGRTLHNIALASFKAGDSTFEEVKYGFTKSGMDKLLKIQRDYVKEHITFTSECNCGDNVRKGDTAMMLPDEILHQSWCEQAKEFGRKLVELKERFP